MIINRSNADKPQENVSTNKILLYFTLIFAELEMLFFSGVLVGLTSIIPTLTVNNYFVDNCNLTVLNITGLCDQQSQFLGYAVLTGSISGDILALPLGAFFDRFGFKYLKFMSAAFVFLGNIFFCLSSLSNNYFIFPAMFLLGLCEQSLCTGNFPLGVLFPKYQNFIVTIFSGSLDASVIIYVVISILNAFGFPLYILFLFCAILGLVLMLLNAVFFLGRIDRLKSTDWDKKENLIDTFPNENKVCPESSVNEMISSQFEKHKQSIYPNLKSALTSRYYVSQLIFTIVIYFRINFFEAQFYLQLSYNFPDNPDKIKNYLFYSNFFSLISIIVSPVAGVLVDALTDRVKKYINPLEYYKSILSIYGIPLLLCSVATVLTSVFIIIPYEWAVYSCLVVDVIAWTMLLSFNAAYIIAAFPDKYFGELYGISITCCGIVSLFQFLLLFDNGNSLNIVNICLIGVSVVSFIQPIMLFLKV